MKSIKSIRIVDSHSPALKQESFNKLAEPELFSFSKRDRNDRLNVQMETKSQREQIDDLERMVKGMLKKCKAQSDEIGHLSG